ncbi:MAG: hypothetical protein ABSC94_04695 [Polyangiaceae bacterium]|jgi:hypothetical protein
MKGPSADFGDFDRIPDPLARFESARSASPKRPQGRSPTRTTIRARRAAAIAAALGYEGWLALAVFHLHAGGRPPLLLWLGLTIPAAACAVAFSAATRSGAQGLGEPVARIAAFAIAAPIFFGLATAALLPPGKVNDSFWPLTTGCMITGSILALGPLACAAVASWRAFATASVWRMGAFGVGCGALAATALSVVCPVTTAFHVVLGHGTAMLLAGGVGALWGKWGAEA